MMTSRAQGFPLRSAATAALGLSGLMVALAVVLLHLPRAWPPPAGTPHAARAATQNPPAACASIAGAARRHCETGLGRAGRERPPGHPAFVGQFLPPAAATVAVLMLHRVARRDPT